jgi:hypothetical protein
MKTLAITFSLVLALLFAVASNAADKGVVAVIGTGDMGDSLGPRFAELGNLEGKIVIDVSMPFDQGEDGYPIHLLDTSSAEMIQGWNPGAKVVKTFATLGSQVIDEPMVEGGIDQSTGNSFSAAAITTVATGPTHIQRKDCLRLSMTTISRHFQSLVKPLRPVPSNACFI